MNQRKEDKEREEYMAVVAEMYDEHRDWRENHPEASIDELAGQITPRRRALMSELMKQLVWQHGTGEGWGVQIMGTRCSLTGGGPYRRRNGVRTSALRLSRVSGWFIPSG